MSLSISNYSNDKIFSLPSRVVESTNGVMQNLILYSPQGTGKSTIAKDLSEFLVSSYPEIRFNVAFFDSDTKIGVDNIEQRLDNLSMFDYSITVIDEAVNLTPDAMNRLRSITTKPNHYFVFCTNEIWKLSPIVRDRFVCIDCSHENTETYCDDFLWWIEDNRPEIFDIIKESEVDFSELFKRNFSGSIREFFKEISNKTFFKSITGRPGFTEAQKIAFNTWMDSKEKTASDLLTIIDVIYKGTMASFQDPHTEFLINWKTLKK